MLSRVLSILILALGVHAQAYGHALTIEEGEEPMLGDAVRKWERATAHAYIDAADQGRTGAVFIGITNDDNGILTLSPIRWEVFTGGLPTPTTFFDALPSAYDVIVFDASQVDAAGRHVYDLGLVGNTLCEAAHAMESDYFTVAIGYGVVDETHETTLERVQNLGAMIDVDHVRLAHAYNDMLVNKRWEKVYERSCPILTGGN